MARSRVRERRDPEARVVAAKVRRGLELPSPKQARRVSRGGIWGVTLVKNEEDVLDTTLRHLLSQGVDGILVVDNGSTDATVDVIRGVAADGAPVFMGTDREPTYYQGEKVTRLAHWARQAGAEWVIPFDADELWFAQDAPLADHLRKARANIERALIHNVIPREPGIPIGAATGWFMGSKPSALHKVAFRVHPFARVAPGNHAVDRPGPTAAGLRIAHFPYRSRDQMAKKVQAGTVALQGLPTQLGNHWRALGGLADDELEDTWAKLTAGESPEGVGWLPDGDLREVDVLSWKTWNLPEA